MSRTFLAFLLSGLVGVLVAQDPTRLDAHRITSGEFAAQRFGPARWLDGAHYAILEPKESVGVLELVRYEAVSGKRDVLVSATMLATGGGALTIEDYRFSPDKRSLLVFTQSERVWRQNTRGEYYVVTLDARGSPRRLGGDLPKASLMFAQWSPEVARVAYVAQNDLFVEDAASGKVTRLTKDGSATVINGAFDSAYEEDFDCREGFRWSPDGKGIAYWQLDCSGVGKFLMIDNLADRYSKVVPVQFPKAGTTNSSCRIGVIAASGGATVWMNTPGDPRETYLPRMEWHPKGEELMVQWLPREQNVLRVLGCNVKSGDCRVVHEEKDAAYVDVRDDFRWVEKGERFFWTSDVAFQSKDKKACWQAGTIEWDARNKPALVTHVPLTAGFDVMSVDYADPDRGVLYVSSSNVPTRKNLFRVDQGKANLVGDRVRGTMLIDPNAVSQRPNTPDLLGEVDCESSVLEGAWHDYQISTDGSLAIHTFSSFDAPPRIDVVRLPSHERVRWLVDNRALAEHYRELTTGAYRFDNGVVRVDGVTVRMAQWTMFPRDFNDQKSWPVVLYVGGERSQTVKDAWGLDHHLFHRWLAQLGYVVMSVDTSGTAARNGLDWPKALYQKTGVRSSAVWNAAMTGLCEESAWMDRSRLAIWGWSGGGGAMTLNMLFRYPDLFAAGMAVAPVTDLTLCDTISQERYCGDPRQFPEVYRQGSPITFASDLKAHLLLVHGTGDDEVHFQHSERLFDELVKHGKLFEYLAYPNRTHTIREREGTRAHLYVSLADFLQRRVPAGPRAQN